MVDQVNTQVEDNLGQVQPLRRRRSPSALFFFILIANWLELIPTELNHDLHLLPAPTADTNLTYAMALMVMVGVWTYGIRHEGRRRATSATSSQPYTFLLPLNIIEEITKPITLALRLFGNIFAGGILLALIAR